MRVGMVPSYRCDAECAYCYARPFQGYFSDSMSLERFALTVADLLLHGLTSIAFLGGEPTLWPLLPEALGFLKHYRLKSVVLTNGHCVNGLPDEAVVNITGWRRAGIASDGVNRLEQYAAGNTGLVLRVNLAGRQRAGWLVWVAEQARRFRAPVSLGVPGANPGDRRLGQMVLDFCTRLLDRGVKVGISRPLPACMLTADQYSFLEANCGLRRLCHFETCIPVVNPDGRTVFPCNSLPIRLPLEYVYSDRRAWFRRKDLLAHPLFRPFPACRDCGTFTAEECHGGCLGMRWSPEEPREPAGRAGPVPVGAQSGPARPTGLAAGMNSEPDRLCRLDNMHIQQGDSR
jgi:hypothetical protein